MAQVYYTEDHEWIRVEGDTATVGITNYAQEQLGDLVFVELPEAGRKMKKGDVAVVVELVKAASDVYAPVDGEIVDSIPRCRPTRRSSTLRLPVTAGSGK